MDPPPPNPRGRSRLHAGRVRQRHFRVRVKGGLGGNVIAEFRLVGSDEGHINVFALAHVNHSGIKTITHSKRGLKHARGTPRRHAMAMKIELRVKAQRDAMSLVPPKVSSLQDIEARARARAQNCPAILNEVRGKKWSNLNLQGRRQRESLKDRLQQQFKVRPSDPRVPRGAGAPGTAPAAGGLAREPPPLPSPSVGSHVPVLRHGDLQGDQDQVTALVRGNKAPPPTMRGQEGPIRTTGTDRTLLKNGWTIVFDADELKKQVIPMLEHKLGFEVETPRGEKTLFECKINEDYTTLACSACARRGRAVYMSKVRRSMGKGKTKWVRGECPRSGDRPVARLQRSRESLPRRSLPPALGPPVSREQHLVPSAAHRLPPLSPQVSCTATPARRSATATPTPPSASS